MLTAPLFPRVRVCYNGDWEEMEDIYGAFDGPPAAGALLGARARSLFSSARSFIWARSRRTPCTSAITTTSPTRMSSTSATGAACTSSACTNTGASHFTPFDVGYGIHALTDGYWVPSVKADFPGMVDPARDALIPALYYNDVRQTDFRLYAEAPGAAAHFCAPARGHAAHGPPHAHRRGTCPSGATTSLPFTRAPARTTRPCAMWTLPMWSASSRAWSLNSTAS